MIFGDFLKISTIFFEFSREFEQRDKKTKQTKIQPKKNPKNQIFFADQNPRTMITIEQIRKKGNKKKGIGNRNQNFVFVYYYWDVFQ